MRPRPGFALVFSLLLALALAMAGLGIMAAGVQEAAIASALSATLQARAAAEAAALQRVTAWSTTALDSLSPGEWTTARRDPAWPGTTTRVARLDSTLYLVRAEAATVDGRGRVVARAAAGLLVATPRSDAIRAALSASLAADSRITVEDGVVAAGKGCGGPGPALQAPAIELAADAVVTGSPAAVEDVPVLLPPPLAAAGSVPGADLQLGTTAGTPVPGTEDGACRTGPLNWGAIDATHPCHSLLPVVHVDGHLRMGGGQGRGILVVAGDATLSAGARFHGILLVRGRLLLTEGARITGRVRAGHAIVRGATVVGDACAVDAVLAAPALDRAYRPPGRWWVPQF